MLIYIMPFVQDVCIHHTCMPDILAQYIRALELSLHLSKTSVPIAATLQLIANNERERGRYRERER